MASIAGVKLPDPLSLKGKSIEKRRAIVIKYADKVDTRNPQGIDLSDAVAFVKHFRPAFGNLVLLQSQPDSRGKRTLKLGFDSYCCKSCRTEFDEKDLKAHSPEGLLCPKCGDLVVKAQAQEATP